MDMNNLANSFGIGLAAGISTLLLVTMILIPVSYVMNRFIYHHWIMRVALGFVAFVLFPFFFIGMIIMAFAGLRPAYYFGLIPSYLQTTTPGEPEGFFAIFFKILSIIPHPFLGFMNTEEDIAGYKASVEPLMAAAGSPVVNEELFNAARDAGTIEDDVKWNVVMDRLTPQFQAMFFPVTPLPVVAPAAPLPSP
jgi:hypothetical protein